MDTIENGDELMPSSLTQRPSMRSPNTMNTRAPSSASYSNSITTSISMSDEDAPDDELSSAMISEDSISEQEHDDQDEFTNVTQSKKKKTRDRPWKKAKEYDSIQTDDVDICGVNVAVVSPSTSTSKPPRKSISKSILEDHDHLDRDDDIIYDESTTKHSGTKDQDMLAADDVSSRWSQNISSAEEAKDAHDRAVHLATKNASRQDDIDKDPDDISLSSRDSSKRSAHAQVRLEALKLLELANSADGNKYIVKKNTSVREKSSALRGLGLTDRKQRGNYEQINVNDRDIFTTNPKSPMRGKFHDVEIHEENDADNMEAATGIADGKKTWGSRYSIDRHLRAIHGGLTSQQVLNKMDRDHYNKLNKNTSANNMFKSSPHEDEDDRWGVSDGKKGETHKHRLLFTWIEAIKDKVAIVMRRDDGFHTIGSHRNADHSSSPRSGIFTGVALTNFLDRLSPKSREARTRDNSYWTTSNLIDRDDLPNTNLNFSAGDDYTYEKRNKRKKMFWLAVLCLSLVTLVSIITAVASSRSGRVGGGYISVGEEVKFYVTSDVPFNKADETKLSRELDDLHPRDGDFLIHLGDINQARTTLCTFSVYDDAASLLKQSPIPVMVIPGDNDWNDCPMPEAAFEYWMDKLNRFENNFDPEDFQSFPTVGRQAGRDENFAFLHKGVLFIAVHLVDGKVQDEREWSIRDQENLQWVQEQLSLYESDEYRAIVLLGHAGYSSKVGDFFWPVMDDFKQANKPVLYLHANDGEGMIEYHPVEDFKKFTAVRMEKGSKVAPTQIKVGGGTKPFSYVVTEG